MARKLTQREITLVAAALVVITIGVIYFSSRGGSIGSGPYRQVYTKQDEQRITSRLVVPEIKLDFLGEQKEEFLDQRNLLTFGTGRRSESSGDTGLGGADADGPAGAKTEAEKEEEKEPEVPVEPEEEEDDGTPPLPDPPEMTLQFVGFVGPPRDKIVFLRDEEAEKEYIGEKGEVIAGQFRIVEVGYEHIEMGYSDPLFSGMTRQILLEEWAEAEEDDKSSKKED